MNTIKSYENVTELLKGIGADSSFSKSVEHDIRIRSIGRGLVVLRHKAGLTQADVAIKMNVKQSTISKIERSTNANLRMGDIEAYLFAVGGKMNIAVLGSETTLADQVKFHVHQIHALLDKLAVLSTKDKSLGPHIHKFFFEALFNFVKGVESASAKVHCVPNEQSKIEFVDIEAISDFEGKSESVSDELASC
jgi:transcriptional regulator with XRE-family HTH domain